MSKVLRTVAVIAGSVALIATGLGAFAPKLSKLAFVASKVVKIATVVSAAAGAGATITAPKPIARGSVTQLIIEPEPPRPYLMGETFFAGVLRNQAGYGATISKVPNPYLWEAIVYSGVTCDALVQKQFDFAPIDAYYSAFHATVSQLGLVPETAAMVPPYGYPPGWTTASKLSGCAAIGWNYLFDKDGKRFASGRPQSGAIWRGVKVYDPRLDSTFPGGSGACRLGNESTYVYSRNPALHAGLYAYGRYQVSKKVIGIGIPVAGIDFASVAAWANDCDANEWYVDGVIFEGGSQSAAGVKARNLTDICQAGGGQWLNSGAVLSFDWSRPRVSLDTITDDDIMRAGGIDAIIVQPHAARFNTVRPQYTSPAHNWELTTADAIIGSTYLAEDGESKTQTWPLNLVKGDAQAGELAAYALVDSREIGPITINLPAEWRFYKAGDTLTLNSVRLGYNGQIVIQNRSFNPDTLVVTLTVRSETPAKHDFALGKVAVPPPTPVPGQTGEQRDTVRDEITQFYPVAGRAAQNIATTVAAGGGVDVNQVGTTSIIADSVTVPDQAYNGSTVTGTGASQVAVTLNVTMAEAGDIVVIASNTFTYSAGPKTWELELVIDGNIAQSMTGNMVGAGHCVLGAVSVAEGLRTVTLNTTMEDGTVSINPGAATIIVLRRYR